MVYPKHNRFVVRGSFGSTKEIWSNTLHFNSVVAGGPDNVPSEWDEGDIETALRSFYSSSFISQSAKVTGWRGYQIGADGRVIGNELRAVDYDTPFGGGGAVKYPPQVALVLTLVGADRGPGKFGRIFIPSPTHSIVEATQEIASGGVDDTLNTFKSYVEALLNAMYDPSDIGENLVNVSKVGLGTGQPVVEYRCGLALDTLRTRRNKLLENYAVLSA